MGIEVVIEWVAKAEEDREAALRLLEDKPETVANVIAFHAEQTAEKYLKALLLSVGKEPPPIHLLGVLIDLLALSHPEVERYREDADVLSRFAVRFRYPGASATVEEAKDAVERAERIRAFARSKLGLAG